MMGWLRKDEAQKRAHGSQKLTDLMEQYYYATISPSPDPDRDATKLAKLKKKIGAMLSDPSAYDPNMPIESRLYCQNFLLLLNRTGLKEYQPLLQAAGFDPKRFSDQRLGIKVAKDPYSNLDTLKYIQASGYDFSERDEWGCSLLEVALGSWRDERAIFLLEGGADPFLLGVPSKPFGYLADALIKRLKESKLYVVPLLKHGLIRPYFDGEGARLIIYDYKDRLVTIYNLEGELLEETKALREQCLEKMGHLASSWSASDLRLGYGLGLLPQFLQPGLWQGHELHLYDLYMQMPEHIQQAMERAAPDLIMQATHHLINTHVTLPAQHWGRVESMPAHEVER